MTPSKKNTPISGLVEENLELLLKLGRGNLSRGVRIAVAVTSSALEQQLLKAYYDNDGFGYWLNGKKAWCEPSRSEKDKPMLLSPSESHPYLGKYLTKQQLKDTGHFTERMVRAVDPGRYVQDCKGYWWQRTDPGKCYRNVRGKVMATYLGLAHENDFTEYPFWDLR